jgi:hypothetical protein
MLIAISIYVFLGTATALSVLDDYTLPELIASAVIGAIWPLYVTIKLLQRLK